MQINNIRPKTGKGDNKENKTPRVVQLVCSSTTNLHSYLVLSTYLKWLWSSNAKMSKIKKKTARK